MAPYILKILSSYFDSCNFIRLRTNDLKILLDAEMSPLTAHVRTKRFQEMQGQKTKKTYPYLNPF